MCVRRVSVSMPLPGPPEQFRAVSRHRLGSLWQGQSTALRGYRSAFAGIDNWAAGHLCDRARRRFDPANTPVAEVRDPALGGERVHRRDARTLARAAGRSRLRIRHLSGGATVRACCRGGAGGGCAPPQDGSGGECGRRRRRLLARPAAQLRDRLIPETARGAQGAGRRRPVGPVGRSPRRKGGLSRAAWSRPARWPSPQPSRPDRQIS